MLVSQTPGGFYERFFEEVGKPVDGDIRMPAIHDQLDLQRIATLGVEFGIDMPPPVSQHGRA